MPSVGGFEIFFFGIIMQIIPAFVAMSIWSNKGGSSGLGFVMGLFLGWIGVIVAAVVTPEGAIQVTTNQPLTSAGGTKTCPRCAETVKAAAQVCRFCGHEFEQTPVGGSFRNS